MKKKTFGGVKLKNKEYIARMEILAKNAADTMDQQVRDVLMWGTGEALVNPTPYFLFILELKRKINRIRVSIAEWIAGDSLHEHCNW